MQTIGTIAWKENSGFGNVIGVQTALKNQDYKNVDTFREAIGNFFLEMKKKGWLCEKSIVVFPEYVGTWLVGIDEHASFFEQKTLAQAAVSVALRQPASFFKQMIFSAGTAKAASAVFSLKAKKMAAAYHDVFSTFSRQYKVTTVAGSILLPSPEIKDGVLNTGTGPLYNVSVVYHADGRADAQLVYKRMPIGEELGFTKPSKALPPVFDTPAGRLSVLVCADAWYRESYSRMNELGAEIIAVPAYLSKNNLMQTPWRGYDGPGRDAEKERLDITEYEAWLRFSLPGRMKDVSASSGMLVFDRGSHWELGSDGHLMAISGDTLFEGPRNGGHALCCLWLGSSGTSRTL